jgi:hypothetical protein
MTARPHAQTEASQLTGNDARSRRPGPAPCTCRAGLAASSAVTCTASGSMPSQLCAAGQLRGRALRRQPGPPPAAGPGDPGDSRRQPLRREQAEPAGPACLSLLPAGRYLIDGGARPEREHVQVGGVPGPGLADRDAPGLDPAQGGQDDLGVRVGVGGQRLRLAMVRVRAWLGGAGRSMSVPVQVPPAHWLSMKLTV